jgi:Rieske Fe-S protein
MMPSAPALGDKLVRPSGHPAFAWPKSGSSTLWVEPTRIEGSRRATSTSRSARSKCPYHGSFFDIKTGHVLSLPASRPLKTYPVKVVDDEVFVEVD